MSGSVGLVQPHMQQPKRCSLGGRRLAKSLQQWRVVTSYYNRDDTITSLKAGQDVALIVLNPTTAHTGAVEFVVSVAVVCVYVQAWQATHTASPIRKNSPRS